MDAQARRSGDGSQAKAARRIIDRRLSVAEEAFLADRAGRIARLCHAMAERFAQGGRLLALAASPAARSDARHIAVEFVHPVIVGKRALPALALSREGGVLEEQVRLLARPADIVLAVPNPGEPDDEAAETRAALDAARSLGCVTVALRAGAGAEWTFDFPADHPFVLQELGEVLYHLAWELVHVFFEHRGVLETRPETARPAGGAAGFLYPFLGEGELDLPTVLDDVAASVRAKASEIAALRSQTLTDGADTLAAAAHRLRKCFEAGGRLLALGNGGSATDAMDAVADFRFPPGGFDWTPRPALDLTEDAAILTAIANDIGPDAMFSRQIIAYGRPGDVVVALSTSGNSRNVIHALERARKRGLATIAFVGYDGGRVAAERLADHIVVTRSEHIPRIQEAQASAYHVLRELVEVDAG